MGRDVTPHSAELQLCRHPRVQTLLHNSLLGEVGLAVSRQGLTQHKNTVSTRMVKDGVFSSYEHVLYVTRSDTNVYTPTGAAKFLQLQKPDILLSTFSLRLATELT